MGFLAYVFPIDSYNEVKKYCYINKINLNTYDKLDDYHKIKFNEFVKNCRLKDFYEITINEKLKLTALYVKSS